jgi:SAM-dependent methyltransferase
LALRLIEDYGLRGKRVLEIGCGKGEFLKLICELGNNEGIGFDPGFREDRLNLEGMDRIRVIQDFYSDKYSNYSADFLCCKMTLEHIFDAGDFIGTVRKAIGNDGTYVFFQIPEVTRILNECAFEDIYYEHCSYFSPGSLARLFRSKGFDVLAVKKEYGDQYLTIEARAGGSYAPGPELAEEDDLQFLRDSVATFPMRCEKKLARWRGCLADYARKGSKVVLWGSGSKGVSFLTTLHSGQAIEYVVDINPHRQGYFMSGTGQEIVSPEFLQGYKPDVVIVMNAIYCDEILRQLEELQLSPHLIAV